MYCEIPSNIGIHVLEMKRARDDQNRSTLILFAIFNYNFTEFHDIIVHVFKLIAINDALYSKSLLLRIKC